MSSLVEMMIISDEEREPKEESWSFTKEQVEAVKRFVTDYGYGTVRKASGIQEFYRIFGHCRED